MMFSMMGREHLGIVTLLLGIAALVCAVIPALVYEEPPRYWPWKSDPRPTDVQPRETHRVAGEGAVTVSTKRFSFSFGKKKKSDIEEAATQPAVSSESVIISSPIPPPSPTRPFMLAAAGLAFGGLLVGPFAWRRRKQRVVASAGMMFCCLALAWQYIVVGILIGVAIGVLLLIMRLIAG